MDPGIENSIFLLRGTNSGIQGTGFAISDTEILTCRHVVHGNSSVEILRMPEGPPRIGKVTATSRDHGSDFAVIQSSIPLGCAPLTMLDTLSASQLRKMLDSRRVFALGRQYGNQLMISGCLKPIGEINQIRDDRYPYQRGMVPYFQVEGGLPSGMSGSPVVYCVNNRNFVIGNLMQGGADLPHSVVQASDSILLFLHQVNIRPTTHSAGDAIRLASWPRTQTCAAIAITLVLLLVGIVGFQLFGEPRKTDSQAAATKSNRFGPGPAMATTQHAPGSSPTDAGRRFGDGHVAVRNSNEAQFPNKHKLPDEQDSTDAERSMPAGRQVPQPAPSEQADSISQLHEAVFFGNIEKIQTLIAEGVPINKSHGSAGLTPLHVACKQGHAEVTEYLLLHGADTSTFDYAGLLPIHYAACHSNASQLITHLKAAGMDINTASRHSGRSPLHLASEGLYVEGVSALIAAGANTDALDDHKNTSLHLALAPVETPLAQSKRLQIVMLLLKANAKIDLKANDGATAKSLASQLNDEALTSAFKEFVQPLKVTESDGETP